jgi:cyanophycin synthetase
MIELRREAARRLGCELISLDPETGYLFELRSGERRQLLLGGFSPMNNALAARIAEDKFHTGLVLGRAGLRVPSSVRCLRPGMFTEEDFSSHTGFEAAERFAAERGWPLIVKPNRGSRGRDIVLVEDQDALRAAVERVWRLDYLALVQTAVAGMDVRLDLLDGEYLFGYTRRGVVLVGDGARSVRDLLAASDPRFTGAGFEERFAVDSLTRHADLDAVPSAGAELDFRTPILNLNRLCHGEILERPPEGLLDVARRAGRTIGLRHFGVDLKVADLEAPAAEAVVVEVNASPSLVHMARLGHREAAIAAEMRVVAALLA